MKLKRFLRLRHFLRSSRLLISDSFLSVKESKTVPNTLLIIKTEAIGDYVIFRNFLELTRKSKQFQNFRITLIGNEIWKSLAMKYDKDFVDDFIFINKPALMKDDNYRSKVFKDLRRKGFEYVVNAAYSRELLVSDSIVRASGSPYRIGMRGDDNSELFIFNKIGSLFYNQLFKNSKALFEFYRLRFFFQELLRESRLIEKPYFPNDKVDRKNRAVLLPGAQAEFRRWPAQKFKEIASYLYRTYNFTSVICGSKEDDAIARQIMDESNSHFIENFCGKSLAELPEIIKSSNLAVCHDSGAFHIAVATNTPTVCISNANHYLRFTPYPNEIPTNSCVIYPRSFRQKYKDENKAMNATKYESDFPIGEIEVDEVKEAIIKVLKNYSASPQS